MKHIRKLIFIFVFFQMALGFASMGHNKVSVYFFWGKGCTHCKHAITYLEKMQTKYPKLQIEYLEIWEHPENIELMQSLAKELKFKITGLPVTIIGDKFVVGYYNDETTGSYMEELIIAARANGSSDYVQNHIKKNGKKHVSTTTLPETIKVPIFGDVNIKNISLPLLTILLGAIDGFNPCAMWVLVMLLSFLVAINERKKMIYLGTLFIVTSAFVYYLFLVAWLNIMFFFKFIQGAKILIGLLAIAGGGYYLKDFFTNKEGVCKVTRQKEKQKIANTLSKIVEQKRYWLAGIGIIILAFLVNLIELVCSAGLPAIYTQVLSITPLSKLGYHLYLLLYTFVFMLDDLLIFMIAIFSLEMLNLTNKYSRYSHLIGGIMLVGIGTLLIFKPEWLLFQ